MQHTQQMQSFKCSITIKWSHAPKLFQSARTDSGHTQMLSPCHLAPPDRNPKPWEGPAGVLEDMDAGEIARRLYTFALLNALATAA